MKRWKGRILIVVGAAFFIAALVWIGLDRRIPRTAFEPYSVHNTTDEGLSLAYQYLRRSRGEGSEGTLSRPLERAFLDPRGVLFRIRPDSPIPPGLRKPKKQNL